MSRAAAFDNKNRRQGWIWRDWQGRVWGSVLLTLMLGFGAPVSFAMADDHQTHDYTIQAQDLGSALKAFAFQSQREIFFAPELTQKKQSHGVNGNYEDLAALKKILRDTGLSYTITASKAILVKDPAAQPKPIADASALSPEKGAAEADQGSVQPAQTQGPNNGEGPQVSQASPTQPQVESGKLEEIIVTAQKRAENLQDVPASVEVVSANALKDTKVDSVQELSRAVPGFTVTQSGVPFSSITIRGIGTVSNGYSVEPSVATIIDGVVLARTGASVAFNFNDVDRVEVLRGPQGTLFGKNASGGALNIVTKDPTNEPSADLSVRYGSYHELYASGAASGALIDNVLQGRISFVTDNHNGYIHDAFAGNDLVGNHEQGVRVKLRYLPEWGARITLAADYASQNTGFATTIRDLTQASGLAETGQLPEFAGFPPGSIGPTNSQYYGAGGFDYFHNKSKGASLTWEQDIGDFTLTSITAYRKWTVDSDDSLTLNDTPVVFGHVFQALVDQHQTSEELRVTSPKGRLFDYVAGLFFYKDSLANRENWLLDLRALAGTPVGVTLVRADYTSVTDSLNYAAFGEANIHITDALTLILGVRETRDKASMDLGGTYLGGAPIGAVDSDTVNNTSWRVGARWAVDQENALYATVSRGFKGPGFNGNSTILGEAQRVNPEVATSYELGWKSELLDQHLRANLAAFWTNLDQFQVQGYIEKEGIFTQFLVNAGQLRSRGLELELDSSPLQGLSIDLNAAYIDSKYTDFVNSPCYTGQTEAQGCVDRIQNLNGKVTPNTPKYSFNINAGYDLPLPSMPFDILLHADYAWRDKVEWDYTNNPLAVEGSYGVLGAEAGITSKDRRYTLTAYGRNLTDKFHTVGIGGGPGGTIASVLLPDYKRIWGVRFDLKL